MPLVGPCLFFQYVEIFLCFPDVTPEVKEMPIPTKRQRQNMQNTGEKVFQLQETPQRSKANAEPLIVLHETPTPQTSGCKYTNIYITHIHN